VEQVNRAAVACARRAAKLSGRDVLVAGSIGPTGEMLAPLGTLEPDEARAAFAAQAAALDGCDLLVVETMFSLDEATAAVLGCRDATALPIVVSFSFDAGVGEPRTMMGHTVEDVLLAMAVLGVDGIGFNCGKSLDAARATAQEFVAQMGAHGLDLPLWVKPNAGLPEPMSGRYPAGPDDMASFAAWAASLGASVVGGCCGTTGAHLHEIHTKLT
jgi:5-methyltetrahydrofolate--homocysteine methyltransferase